MFGSFQKSQHNPQPDKEGGFMLHRNDDENDKTSHPLGNYQLKSRLCWFAQSLRVTKGTGLTNCRGSLLVLDRGSDQPRERKISWTAERQGEVPWEVVGQPYFDDNQGVDFELRRLVQNKLNSMVREGTLSNAPIKQTHDDQSSPLAPAPPSKLVAVNTTTIKTTSVSGSSGAYDSSAVNRELLWLLMSSRRGRR